MKKEIKSGKDSFEAKMVRERTNELDEPYEYQCIIKVAHLFCLSFASLLRAC